MFGVHFDQEPNRFQIMQKENPKMYRYCMEELKMKQVLEYCGIPHEWRDVPKQDRINLNLRNEGNNMNLRDLNIFVADQMDDRLAECGIDVNQIIQIKILDRRYPPDDSVVWMLRPQDHKFDYETVITMLQRWITNQIVICYMTDNLDRDLAIEIMGNGKGMMAI